MDEKAALEWLERSAEFRIDRYNLDGITELLKGLGNPEKFLKYIHIAGTNGKGSVARICSDALAIAGYKTGLFVSPHIISFNERIQINGRYIETKELVALIGQVYDIVEKLKQNEIYCSQFDIITAIALKYFSDNRCNIVVLEVGMGGRLDSTNVIPAPEIAIITKISFDHINELGNTLEKIAFEKAGIIKKGSLCVCSAYEPLEVVKILQQKCFEENADFLISYKACNVVYGFKHNHFEFNEYKFETGLGGIHQVDNAMIAITALLNFKIPITYIQQAIKQVFWPARLEIFSELKPKFILDGAHNVDGFCVLAESLKLCDFEPKIGVISMLSTKDYKKALKKVVVMGFEKIIITQMKYKNVAKVEDLEYFAKMYGLDYIIKTDWKEAIRAASSLAGEDGVVVVFGSLYFASMVREELIGLNNIDQ